jgi:hypothetical protein
MYCCMDNVPPAAAVCLVGPAALFVAAMGGSQKLFSQAACMPCVKHT